MSDQEVIDQELDGEMNEAIRKVEVKDPTNWKVWYIGLILFLVVQIAVYLWITNLYAA